MVYDVTKKGWTKKRALICMKDVYAGFSLVCYNSFVLICAVLSFPPGVWAGILNLTVQSFNLCAFCFTFLISL